MSDTALERIGQLRILPVVVIHDQSVATPLGRALVDGGLPLAEVTLRTPGAEAALAELAGNDDLVVGAGTVISAAQVDRAVDAGAAFIVSPGLDDQVVAQARARDVPIIPGVATATEIQRALAMGLSTVKLFPAGQLGGPAMVAALSAPFPAVRFVPTGGIGPADLADYLALPSVFAVGGSWLVAAALLRDARWEVVTQLARDARSAAGREAAS
jgi:2-dehydro-3-deoxyphosphogluconate aldolase/(4S)-4-hydroxy-2-oxoglutarate aldolase